MEQYNAYGYNGYGYSHIGMQNLDEEIKKINKEEKKKNLFKNQTLKVKFK